MKVRRLLIRSFIVWLAIIVAEVFHGVVRAAVLVPQVGDARARQIGVLTGSVIILALAVAFVRRLGATSRRQLFVIGVLWVVLTVIFETVFGRFVLGASWQRLLSDYNPAEGGFLGFGMLFLALAPFLATRIRCIESARDRSPNELSGRPQI
jgi:hypothetical protein